MMHFLGSWQIHANNELIIDSDHSVDKWNKFLWVKCCQCVVISLKFVDLSMKFIHQLHLRRVSLQMKPHPVILPQIGFLEDETHPATSPQMGFLFDETLPVTLPQTGFLEDETHPATTPQMGFLVDETLPVTLPQIGFLVGVTHPVTSPQIGFLVDEASSGNFISEGFP
jgi:hypothetical protein